jgi:oxygen-independent coproporphyrinogen-3 oxidase
MIESAAVPISESLIRQYDVSGPRYTSYPTADRFVEAFTSQDYIQALEQRHSGASALVLPLSLYVHIPFCESLVLLLCVQQDHHQAP